MKYLLMILMSTVIHFGLAQSLKGIRICIDPGHGGTSQTDFYRVGINGEREEWVNLRVAKYLQKMLSEEGALVQLTREEDVFVDLLDRAKIAKDFSADLFVSIHHNGTADTSVNCPVVYFHGSTKENISSVYFAELLVQELNLSISQRNDAKYAIVSDYLIFPNRGAAVLRGTYGIPAVIGEASYFTNPSEEWRLKDTIYNKEEALAYYKAIQNFFKSSRSLIYEEKSLTGDVLQISVNQEASRMDSNAMNWSSRIDTVLSIIRNQDFAQYPRAEFELLDIMRLFPDNYRVKEVYESLLHILKVLKKEKDYILFKNRYENYVYTFG